MINFMNVDLMNKSSSPLVCADYDGMNLARHHVFSAFNYSKRTKSNVEDLAGEALLEENKIGRVDGNGGMGIGVELKFFEKFQDELKLIPALDCGDHTDFAGMYKGSIARFDVTTCRESKQASDYTRDNHWVVVYDSNGGTWSFCSSDGIELSCEEIKR